jgi:hypothetical protein
LGKSNGHYSSKELIRSFQEVSICELYEKNIDVQFLCNITIELCKVTLLVVGTLRRVFSEAFRIEISFHFRYFIHSFIHLLKFHKILTRLRQPVDIEIVEKKAHLAYKKQAIVEKQIYNRQDQNQNYKTLTILG